MSEIHQTMLRCGYIYTPSRHISASSHLRQNFDKKGYYIKEYNTDEGTFKIVLIFKHDPSIHLPLAYILEKPEKFNDVLLPHINFGWYLCYVQELEADWNPNDLDGTYSFIDHQIQLTLNNSVKSISNGEIEQVELEGEFSAYWQAKNCAYSLSNFNDLTDSLAFLTENQKLNDKNFKEWVLYHKNQEEQYKKWLEQRSLTKIDSTKVSTRVVKIRPNRLSGINWPPKNFKELISWLADVDHNAKAFLIDYFVKYPVKNHLLLLDVDKQDTLGLMLELNLNATQLSTYAHSKKNTKKNGRKVQHTIISSLLAGKNAFNQFKRLSFVKADQQTIINRNRRRPAVGDLSSKKIALIGCGTIGGYLSELLLKSGAGVNKGKLDLYDFDTYQPQNFGRHSLTSCDFGKSKASALKDKLNQSTHLSTNIRDFQCSFPLESKVLQYYDIIIDATGRPPIAKRLAYLIRNLQLTNTPILIHGFNDGNGRASKVFIDYSIACINCLNKDPAFYKNSVDLRFLHLSELNEKKVSCGSTYTPYDAAVSITTAALIQEAALSTLEEESTWNYKEHIFEGGRTRNPSLIKPKSYCDICNAK
ncbi:E2/UBC family protein [uncultured Acinetobacter sp.]|uniref:E2/UBC family protein n=1 Tax=uncultured Acinetobacter sp. TaxID=165433 RepID=UPI0025851E4C|nr:E2/UBC family protein [uncultured Acinetobacter sp.]